MDSYTPVEPPVDSNRILSHRIACLGVAAVGTSLWCRQYGLQDDAFPTVFAQNTKRNQAMCSLMSAVLLRKAGDKKELGWRRRRNTSRIRESLSLSEHGCASDEVSLMWHISGHSKQQADIPASIHVPTVFIACGGRASEVQPIADSVSESVARRGWIAVQQNAHNGMSTSETIRLALCHVASKLSSNTPLFLVGDDTIMYESSMITPCCANLVGIIQIDSRNNGRNNIRMRARNCLMRLPEGVPSLVLNLSGNVLNSWRNDPNMIVVLLNNGEQKPHVSWAACCVLHFIDSALRLREMWDNHVPLNLQARL